MTIKETVDAIKQDLHACNLHWLSDDEAGVIEQYLTAAVEAGREEKLRLREALKEYANKDNWHSTNGEWANVFDDGSPMDGYGTAECALGPETEHEKRQIEIIAQENIWMRDRLAEADSRTAEANKRAEAWRIQIEVEREACAKIADKELKARRECLKAADERKDQHSYSGHWFAITAAETIAKEIRALGEEKGEGEK